MIQIDTISPELGQVVPQDLRNNRADLNSDDSTEFSQIWSEFSEPDSSGTVVQVDAQVAIAKQSDTVASEESSDLEVEDAEVLNIPHHVEARLSDAERTHKTQLPDDGSHRLQAKTQIDPSTPQLFKTPQKPAGGVASQQAGLDAPESPDAGTQFVAPHVRTETATSTANPIYPTTPPPHAGNTAVKSNSALQLNTTPVPSKTASAGIPLVPGDGAKTEQLHQKLGTDQALFQTIVHDQNNNARTPIDGAIKRAVQSTEISARPRGQVTASTDTTTDRVLATDSKQAPLHTVGQTPNIPTPAPRSSQEWPLAPQSVAKPNLSIPSKETPNLLNAEPLFPVSTGASETEFTSPQTLQVNSAKVSTAAASASHTIAPQVTSQVAAAIFQSSNSTTEILLNPEELGRVRISLTNGEAGMTVNILSERLETTDLMRRNIELLARELRDLGYENPSFTFGEQSSKSNDTWDDDDQESPSESSIQLPEPPAPSMRVTLTGGLDLKL